MEIIEKILENIKNGRENYFQIKNRMFLDGERIIEIPWALSKYKGQKRVLDVGTTHFDVNYFKYFAELLKLGVEEFHSIDIISFKPERFKTIVPKSILTNLIFKKGDIRNSGYTNDFFDLIFCISTIEHIGFDKESINPEEDTSFDRPKKKPKKLDWKKWNGDYKVVRELLRIVKPSGLILLTVPFGKVGIYTVKDTKGRYAQFFQYDYGRLQSLLNMLQRVKIEDRYFYFDKNEGWKESKTPEDLDLINMEYRAEKSSTEKKGAQGVACIEIKKL